MLQKIGSLTQFFAAAMVTPHDFCYLKQEVIVCNNDIIQI